LLAWWGCCGYGCVALPLSAAANALTVCTIACGGGSIGAAVTAQTAAGGEGLGCLGARCACCAAVLALVCHCSYALTGRGAALIGGAAAREAPRLDLRRGRARPRPRMRPFGGVAGGLLLLAVAGAWVAELVLRASWVIPIGSGYGADALGVCMRALAAIQDVCALGALIGLGWHVEQLQHRWGGAAPDTTPREDARASGRVGSADGRRHAGRAAAAGSLRRMACGLAVVAAAYAALYHASMDGKSALKLMLGPVTARCADDPRWVDGVHGNGLHGCREVAEHRDWCSDHGWEDASGRAYAFEARHACPAACGTCAPPPGPTRLAVPAALWLRSAATAAAALALLRSARRLHCAVPSSHGGDRGQSSQVCGGEHWAVLEAGLELVPVLLLRPLAVAVLYPPHSLMATDPS
jgi:hypothetical protein